MENTGKSGKTSLNADDIKLKIRIKKVRQKAVEETKPTKCIVCGKEQTKFCNSHSVPRMVLKNIADKGIVLQSNALIGEELIDIEKGVNSTGTFHFICRECDSVIFRDYEDEENLNINTLTDTMLSEIALKNCLLLISKSIQNTAIYKILAKRGKLNLDVNRAIQVREYDEKGYYKELNRYLDQNAGNVNSFNIVCNIVLPYVVPIATQTTVAMQRDMDGNAINDVYDVSANREIERMHIAIFPLKSSSIVLAFYNRVDKKYRSFYHQMNSVSDEEKLKIINYLLFKYSEDYYFSPKIKEILETDKNLVKLSREVNDFSDLGHITYGFLYEDHKLVKHDEIPNLLSRSFALEKITENICKN